MNNSESSGSTADRYQVIVHVSNTETSSDLDSHIEDGPHVTAVKSRRIACDSTVVALTQDANGEPLSIGRRSRTIPPPLRRALRVRDKGCRFPGLAAYDSIQEWLDSEFFESDIDSESCTAKWRAGERIDWRAAVGGLF